MVGIRPTLARDLLMLALLPASAPANATRSIIVKRDPGLTAAERADIRADAGVRLRRDAGLPRTEVVAAQPRRRRATRCATSTPTRTSSYAERDRRAVRAAADPDLDEQWGSDNTGQLLYDDWAPGHRRRRQGRPRGLGPHDAPARASDGRRRRHRHRRGRTPTSRATSLAGRRLRRGRRRGTRPTATATARTSRARSPRRATTARASPASRPSATICRCARSTTAAAARRPTSPRRSTAPATGRPRRRTPRFGGDGRRRSAPRTRSRLHPRHAVRGRRRQRRATTTTSTPDVSRATLRPQPERRSASARPTATTSRPASPTTASTTRRPLRSGRSTSSRP